MKEQQKILNNVLCSLESELIGILEEITKTKQGTDKYDNITKEFEIKKEQIRILDDIFTDRQARIKALDKGNKSGFFSRLKR